MMATVIRSPLHPSLVVSDLGVRFVDGVLVTEDPRVIARAHRLAFLGVVVGDEPETDDEDSAGDDATDPEFPSEEWTVAQIDDWAKQAGISLAGARSKSAKLAAITAALAEPDSDADSDGAEADEADDDEHEDEDDAEAESASTSTDW